MRYEIIATASVSAHQAAVVAQQALRTTPYPAQIFDAHCDNTYHFVRCASDITQRAGYSLTGDDSEGLFWYSRGIDGRMVPWYGAPELRGESDEKVAARPVL